MRILGFLDESLVVLLVQLGLTLRFLSWIVVHLEERPDDVQVHEVWHKGRENKAHDGAENDVDTAS